MPCDLLFSLRLEGDPVSRNGFVVSNDFSGEHVETVARRGLDGVCIPGTWSRLGPSDERSADTLGFMTLETSIELWSFSVAKIWFAARILRGRREERLVWFEEIELDSGATGRDGSVTS